MPEWWPVADAAGAWKVRPGGEQTAELLDPDRLDLATERLEERPDFVEAGGVGGQNRAVGLAEAERVEVLDRDLIIDVEQESARVAAFAPAGAGLLDHADTRAGVVRRDRRARAGGAEADHEHVEVVDAHGAVVVIGRCASVPSQSSAARRTVS